MPPNLALTFRKCAQIELRCDAFAMPGSVNKWSRKTHCFLECPHTLIVLLLCKTLIHMVDGKIGYKQDFQITNLMVWQYLQWTKSCFHMLDL